MGEQIRPDAMKTAGSASGTHRDRLNNQNKWPRAFNRPSCLEFTEMKLVI